MPQLIIASGDSDLVSGISGALASVRRDIEITATVEGAVAVQRLGAGDVDVAVVDLRLVGAADAVAVVLGAAARSPSCRVLVIDPNHEADVARTTSGAVTWAGVGAARDEITGAISALVDRRDGYRESLRDLTFQDVLTLVNAAEWTGELFSRVGPNRGSVAVRHGDVIDARLGDAVGMDALVEIVAGDDGSLLVGPLEAERPVGIEGDPDELIRVAFQRAHERRRTTAQHQAVEITDEDLDSFMDIERPGALDDAYDLFSPEELKELELDDAMGVVIAPTKLTSHGEIEVDSDDVLTVVEDMDTVLRRLEDELEGLLFAAVANLEDGEVLAFLSTDDATETRRPAVDDLLGGIAAMRSVSGAPRPAFRECTATGGGLQLVACAVGGSPVCVIAALRPSSNPALARALVRRAAATVGPDLPAPELM